MSYMTFDPADLSVVLSNTTAVTNSVVKDYKMIMVIRFIPRTLDAAVKNILIRDKADANTLATIPVLPTLDTDLTIGIPVKSTAGFAFKTDAAALDGTLVVRPVSA